MATAKQMEANRRNALQSTGPRTAAGKAKSKMNALKHGILARAVVVQGDRGGESEQEFTALHARFGRELAPVGPVEEMLVDQIVTAYWRLRRALRAERGEIQLRTNPDSLVSHRFREVLADFGVRHGWSAGLMSAKAMDTVLEILERLRQRVVADGELTESALAEAVAQMAGPDLPLMRQLDELRREWAGRPTGAEAGEWREQHRSKVLSFLEEQIENTCRAHEFYAEREAQETEDRLTAATLPAVETLDKILRYETTLERQLYRAMHQLERLQRRRAGEHVPAPVTMEIGR